MAYLEDVLDDSTLTPLNEIDETEYSAELKDMSHIGRWCGPNFETLDTPKIIKSSFEQIPTLQLKKLLEDLNYIFLGPEEGTFPVVILSKLT